MSSRLYGLSSTMRIWPVDAAVMAPRRSGFAARTTCSEKREIYVRHHRTATWETHADFTLCDENFSDGTFVRSIGTIGTIDIGVPRTD